MLNINNFRRNTYSYCSEHSIVYIFCRAQISSGIKGINPDAAKSVIQKSVAPRFIVDVIGQM